MTTTLSQRFSFRKLPAAARQNAACLLSFLIPLAVMCGIFIINGVYPFCLLYTSDAADEL